MNQSLSTNQFPQIVWRDEKKHLWNFIHRKALKNRPEERVRLRIIEYLTRGGWSKHRISTEEAVDLPQKESKLRTDLICYSQQFEPVLLIECKAEQVKITEKTAGQIARYNQKIGAPYLLMSNGVTDYWYSIDESNVQPLDEIPSQLPKLNQQNDRPFDYWKARGFAGADAAPKLRTWLCNAINTLMLQTKTTAVRFLTFTTSPTDLDLRNYYLICTYPDHHLAISFTATPFGGSRLMGIINTNSKNTGVIEINLDLLFDGRRPNASFYSAAGVQNIDLLTYSGWNPITPKFQELPRLIKSLMASLEP